MLLGLFVKQGKSHGTGVSILLASLDHTLNTQTLTKTDEQKKKVLGKFTILCWAAFIVILGCGLDSPEKKKQKF